MVIEFTLLLIREARCLVDRPLSCRGKAVMMTGIGYRNVGYSVTVIVVQTTRSHKHTG